MANDDLKLNEEETAIMLAGMNSDYENFMAGPTYLVDVLDCSELEMEVAVATVGNLVRREMVIVRGQGNFKNIQATELGKAICVAL